MAIGKHKLKLSPTYVLAEHIYIKTKIEDYTV